MIKFYSTNCSKCKELQRKLDEKKIEYEYVSDFNPRDLVKRGVVSMPALEVDDKMMTFEEAMNWIRSTVE